MKYSFLRSIPALALALCLAACPALAERIDAIIKVNPDKAITTGNGTFEGWGTSLCWWANRLG